MSKPALLWSVQPPSGQVTYLFGTMHVRDDRVFGVCEQLYPYIQAADVYISEMDLGDSPLSSGTPEYSMQEQFRPQVYAKIRSQILKSFQVDISTYERMHPLLILSALSARILQQDHLYSLDEHLWNYAMKHQIKTDGLETVKEQLDILHQLDPFPLYRQLHRISQKPAGLRKSTSRTVEVYLQHNIHALYKYTKSSMNHLRKPLIYKRNVIMAERIIALDQSLVHFVAVGAGHLSGQYGLIKLLRKHGCKLTPVS